MRLRMDLLGPVSIAVAGTAALLAITLWPWPLPARARLPGEDGAADAPEPAPDLTGTLLRSTGVPADLPGAWPRFRGPQMDGVNREGVALSRSWRAGGPPRLWSLELGEGYAGAAVDRGRVYVLDYDREAQADALRCLSLADGREIWRHSYPVKIKRNHGMSRTVPTVAEGHVVGFGPKCHVTCLAADTGERKWALDLVRELGARVPPWYAGQCPLVNDGRVILAPGGPDALLVALDLKTGRLLWKTPNPRRWTMTHSSLVPVTIDGLDAYLYCASGGTVAVAPHDGSLLWESADWRISIATVPSPVPLGGGRVFFSGGYDAGSLMLRLQRDGERLAHQTLFRLEPERFGAAQQTPIFHQGHLYGVRPDGQLVCLTPEGETRWASGPQHQFGLGPLLIADGLIFAMNDTGRLSLVEASPRAFKLLAEAQVLDGHDSWGPMALAGGRLLARDLTRMVCLDVRRQG